jgi:hypothetical protein
MSAQVLLLLISISYYASAFGMIEFRADSSISMDNVISIAPSERNSKVDTSAISDNSNLTINDVTSIAPDANTTKTDVSVSEVVATVHHPLQVLDYSKQICSIDSKGTKRCKPSTAVLKKGSKVKVLGQDEQGLTYKLEAFDKDGNPLGIFHSSQKFTNKALNWLTVGHALKIIKEGRLAGDAPLDPTCSNGIEINPQQEMTLTNNLPQHNRVTYNDVQTRYENGYRVYDSRNSRTGSGSSGGRVNYGPTTSNSSYDDEDFPPYEGEYIPGCESLAEKKMKKEHKEQLTLCVQNIRRIIAPSSARDSNGVINRDKVFDNMFKKLNPEEQKFAAKMFTSIGEAEGQKNLADTMSIMKVLQNRARLARERENDKKYNELDVALAKWQFSMYNPAEPGWKSILDPGVSLNSSSVEMSLDAMIALDNTDTSRYNDVYLYHANYVNPKDWDFNLLSEPFAMDFGEGNKTKYNTKVYHKFFVSKSGSPQGVVGLGNFTKRRRNNE